jgi:Spy/CpxP family protein refolding chaperone
MTRNLTSMFAAALLLIAAAASAQGPGRGPGPGFGPGDGPQGPGGPGMGIGMRDGSCLIDYLGLSDEQVAAWQNLRDQLHATLEPIREQRVALHERIQAALTSEGADACAVGQLMVQAHALGDQMRAAREANQTSFVALLTAEQQTKYQQFKEVRGMCRGDRGQRGAGMRRGRAQGRRSSS